MNIPECFCECSECERGNCANCGPDECTDPENCQHPEPDDEDEDFIDYEDDEDEENEDEEIDDE